MNKQNIANKKKCWYITALFVRNDASVAQYVLAMVERFERLLVEASDICAVVHPVAAQIIEFWKAVGYQYSPNHSIFANEMESFLILYKRYISLKENFKLVSYKRKREKLDMLRKIFCAIMTVLFCFQQAAAEKNNNTFTITDSVNDTLSQLEIVIADTGRDSGDNNILSATITALDESFSQQLFYYALESPLDESDLLFARLVDLNFDGYLDLSLLTAAGIENIYTTFALWNPQAGRFDPVMTAQPWISEEQRFSDEAVQIELCNYRLLPESKRICSEAINGFRDKTRIVYQWTDDRTLCEDSLLTIYQAGDGMICEKLEILREGASYGWNHQYPEEWYYGEARVEKERIESLDYVMFGDAINSPMFMQVANVDWVNVRLEDSKESPSIAKLDVGCVVQVLKTGCGEDEGWVRVWYISEDGKEGYTGYIWHRYLE